MYAFLRFTTVAATLALVVPHAVAQTEMTWNRRISDVRIVHPPATPPGTWRLECSVGIDATGGIAPGTDVSFALVAQLNGIDIGVIHQPAEYPNGPSCSNGSGGCNPGQCNGIYNGAGYIPGVCGSFASPLTGVHLCGCATAMGIFDFGQNYNFLVPGDVITIELNDDAGSSSELYRGDNSGGVTVHDNPIGTSFCAGDASSPVPCPCGNSGADGHGCANSTNPDGAVLGATGWSQPDSVTGTDTVVLHGSGMPATSTAIYLKGDAGATPTPFGDGLLCTGGALVRLRTKINVGGASQFPEAGDPSLSVRGGTPPGSGLVGRYQVYYRNASAAFCPPSTFNVSSGVQIDW